jgi:threonylcarbamoyladenosine tRNA methylthiotransferase MtaB
VATFYVTNFGCRATQADGAGIERQLLERGLKRADEPATAGLVVLNTCTVTAAADQDARAAIRRIHRTNPEAQIVVTGCYAQRAPEEIAALPGVTQVIGNSHKHLLAELAGVGPRTSDLGPQPSDVRPRPLDLDCQADSKSFVPITQLTSVVRGLTSEVRSPIFVSDIFAHSELHSAPIFDAANERTRPNLKVQDGCDNRCSFCVIPYVRGQSRSLNLDEVIREVETLVNAGYREVVISGINLGRWGRDLAVSRQTSALGPTFQGPTTNERRPVFEDLVRTVLFRTALEKLRISSVEPMDWTDSFIRLMAESPRIAKHTYWESNGQVTRRHELASGRGRRQGRLLEGAVDARGVRAEGGQGRHPPDRRRIRLRQTPAGAPARGIPHEQRRLGHPDDEHRKACRDALGGARRH